MRYLESYTKFNFDKLKIPTDEILDLLRDIIDDGFQVDFRNKTTHYTINIRRTKLFDKFSWSEISESVDQLISHFKDKLHKNSFDAYITGPDGNIQFSINPLQITSDGLVASNNNWKSQYKLRVDLDFFDLIVIKI